MAAVGAEDAPSPGEQVVHAEWSPGQQVQPFLMFMIEKYLTRCKSGIDSLPGLNRTCRIVQNHAQES